MERIVTINLHEDGLLICLQTDDTACFEQLGSVTTRRASHVEPDALLARVIFHSLRSLFGDKGWMASFTRHWPCLWRVNLKPIGGPILDGRWYGRQKAIDAEVDYLGEHLV